jgi:hypothetical protein
MASTIENTSVLRDRIFDSKRGREQRKAAAQSRSLKGVIAREWLPC